MGSSRTMNSQKLENSQPTSYRRTPDRCPGQAPASRKIAWLQTRWTPAFGVTNFQEAVNDGALVKSPKFVNNVIPANPGSVSGSTTSCRRKPASRNIVWLQTHWTPAFGVTNFQEAVNDDALVKSPKFVNNVIPANPGSVSGSTTSCRRKPASRNIVWLQTHWTPAFGVTNFQEAVNDGALVKSPKFVNNVIPANPGSVSGAGAGVQKYRVVANALDPGVRRGDDLLRVRQKRFRDSRRQVRQI